MERTMFERLTKNGRRLFWGAALLCLAFAAAATLVADVSPEAKRTGSNRARIREALSLFAGPSAVLKGNLVQCGLVNTGDVCTDVFNSPTGGGGFWPTGSPDQYIFNSGLQVAGIIPDTVSGNPWAGDTVGAYFFDASGLQPQGSPVSDIYDSQNPSDLANWPNAAYVTDPTLFQQVLLGRKTASQQDSWTQYWDAEKNPSRPHPMGIEVTQRSLAWNYPSGNESIIYFIYDFKNVTNDPDFQKIQELNFFAGQNKLPDGGWPIGRIFAAVSADHDVTTNATQNFATAILPFDMGISYHGGFDAPGFQYPPNLFKPPFFTHAPGIVAVKYLKTPNDIGLSLFSQFTNGPPFSDPSGSRQLWRYLSGNVSASLGDPTCTVNESAPGIRPVCFVGQNATDTRLFASSGPFELDPGSSATFVVAYIMAATVATLPDGTPTGIVANSGNANANPPGIPSEHPGCASIRGSSTLTKAQNPVKPIEMGAGWIPDNTTDKTMEACPASLESAANKTDQFSVKVTPGSLLGKALVAQTIFDNKFLLGFAPDAPTFYLAPGDKAVTIIWNPSPAEKTGDPFFTVTSDSTSALYNPNYRHFDVEGYKIWRGTSASNLSVIAQFDYDTTTFFDYTCETVLPDEDVGAQAILNEPGGAVDTVAVKGYAAGEICPLGVGVDSLARDIDQPFIFNNGGQGGSPGGGVVRLTTLTPQAVKLDTAVTGGGAEAQPLSNSGVPFVYVDQDVNNNFTYFYAVTAFDVNSEASGPASLESPPIAQSAVPRHAANNLKNLFTLETGLSGDDGQFLANTDKDNVQPDPDTGIFPSSQPPTNAITLSVVPDPSLVGDLLSSAGLVGTIDSVVPHDEGEAGNPCPNGVNGLGACLSVYTTVDGGSGPKPVVVNTPSPVWSAFGEPSETSAILGTVVVPFKADELARYGIPASAGAGVSGQASAKFPESINNSWFEGQSNRRGLEDGSVAGGSRWFDGTTETVADPTTFVRVGHLDEVDTVWAPIHHTPTGPGADTYAASGSMQCFGYVTALIGRAADVQVTWQGGTFGEVRDVTHHVDVPFGPQIRGTYGFLTTDANGNGVLDWQDFDYLEPMNVAGADLGFCNDDSPVSPISLANAPVIMPTSTQGVAPGSMTQTGEGFGLYINGERYIFETSSLPADGTVWTLRTYSGVMSADDGETNDPSNYSLKGGADAEGTVRPPTITGLKFTISVTKGGTAYQGKPDLTKVHTVPDPYLATSAYDLAPTEKQLMFVNLPAKATIRIYSLSGVLVRVLDHNDPSGGGREAWNLRNRTNQFIASGVYFWQVITPQGDEQIGKFTVVDFAGQ